MLVSLYKIASTEGGIHSLFRGNVAATYLWMSYTAFQFSFYDWTAHELSSNTTMSSNAVAFVSGASAGVFATLATYPLDICRTAFAAQGLQNKSGGSSSWTPPKSIWEFALTLYRQEGTTGFFAGAQPAVVQVIPYMGLNFLLYEFFVSRDPSVGTSGMTGAVSGGVSKIVVYPLDTVKRRIQVQAISGTVQYRNMMDCLFTIARTEGVYVLYNGLVPSAAKTMIGTGLSFAIFTLVKNTLSTL
jgi:solute carrier family 25 thiamine pyrophosphate transporter 19